MLVGFLCLNFLRPISEQRKWLRWMTLKSTLVDGHLYAQCLVCLQLARNVIPGQMLAIGYSRSRVALGRSDSFQQTPAFKWVNICQLSRSRLSVQMKWSRTRPKNKSNIYFEPERWGHFLYLWINTKRPALFGISGQCFKPRRSVSLCFICSGIPVFNPIQTDLHGWLGPI